MTLFPFLWHVTLGFLAPDQPCMESAQANQQVTEAATMAMRQVIPEAKTNRPCFMRGSFPQVVFNEVELTAAIDAVAARIREDPS